MQEGDKVICKRQFNAFIIGEEYIIESIDYYGNLYIMSSSDIRSGWWFYHDNLSFRYTFDLFKEYFYTEKELRRLKLEKIK